MIFLDLNWNEPLTKRELIWGRIMGITGFVNGIIFGSIITSVLT